MGGTSKNGRFARSPRDIFLVERMQFVLRQQALQGQWIREHSIKVLRADRDESNAEFCPSCRVGLLVARGGKLEALHGVLELPTLQVHKASEVEAEA